MKNLTVICIAILFTFELNAQVVINEIMYSPTESSNEWYELHNIGPSAVDIQNWKWRDFQNTSLRTITTQSILIQPGSYIVVCQDSAKFKTQFPNVPGIYVESMSWSSLNNSGDDGVALYAVDNSLVDSVIYNNSWGGTGGISLERVDPNGPSNSQSNWGSSVAVERATPNQRNSISPLGNNLVLSSFSITPPDPSIGGSIQLNLIVRNTGLNSASNFSLNVFNNPALDTNLQNSTLVTSQQYSNLNSGDSIVFPFTIDNLDSGLKQYIGHVYFPLDEDTTNNFLVKQVTVGGGPVITTGVVVNEIMYAPQSPELEWFEIFNNSNDVINLQNWKWKDATSTLRTITTDAVNLSPFEYAIVCQDSASMRQVHPGISGIILQSNGWSALNNSGDDLILIAPNDVRVDSVPYLPAWGGSSRNSLERLSPSGSSIDPANWATSISCNFSTPNIENSISSLIPYERGDVSINEIMFDPFTGETEWIEVVNISTKNIQVSGWVIDDNGTGYQIADTCAQILLPGGYIVLAGDTTIFTRYPELKVPNEYRRVAIAGSGFSLSNSGEPIVLKDAAGNVIDSVYYNSNWKNPNLSSSKGISIERINPVLGSNDRQNWSSCTRSIGGTPGERNSIYIDAVPTSEQISISPNPFSPDGDGFEDFTIISYKFKSLFSQVTAKVYDAKGRLVRTLANNQLSGGEGEIIFNGLDDDNRKLRLGIYIVYIEAINDQGGIVESVKAPVVVATKL